MNRKQLEYYLKNDGIDLYVKSVSFEGEGDFCAAYTVNDVWIFRFATNAEGSRSLECEAELLPGLAATLPLAIPVITFLGHMPENGWAFTGHPKINGIPLTAELLLSLNRSERERCVTDLAEFLRALHSYDTKVAKKAGIVECVYPFCRTEEGISKGDPSMEYYTPLKRLLDYGILDAELQQYCVSGGESLIRTVWEQERTLVHGDLAAGHILYDLTNNKISGIIDFTDAIITTSLLDIMYLYSTYGRGFANMLLRRYALKDREQMLDAVHNLYSWYTMLRLLWVLDHNYEHGIQLRLDELRESRS